MSEEQAAIILTRVGELGEALAHPSSNRLEDLVAQLSAKVERVSGAGAPDPRAIQVIENQLMRIAERLERNSGSVDAMDTIERSISDIVAQIANTRAAPPEHASREQQEAREDRTQATLHAVHETLEKVVDRLALLESDVGTLRHRESAPEQVQQAEADPAPLLKEAGPNLDAAEAPAPEPVALPPLAQHAPEILIEPGTGFTPPTLTRESGTGESDAALTARQDLALDIEEPRAAKASFIAAARRATQISGSPPPPVRHDDEATLARAHARAAAESLQENGNQRVADTIRRTVYGCTALALILAGWQFTQGPKRPRAIAQNAIEWSASTRDSVTTAQDMPAAGDVIHATTTRSRSTEELLLELAQNGQAPAQHEMGARLLEGRNIQRRLLTGSANQLNKIMRPRNIALVLCSKKELARVLTQKQQRFGMAAPQKQAIYAPCIISACFWPMGLMASLIMWGPRASSAKLLNMVCVTANIIWLFFMRAGLASKII